MTMDAGVDFQRVSEALAQSRWRLRFELSGGGAAITQFSRAYDRARALARAALDDGSALYALIAEIPELWDRPRARQRYGKRGDAFALLPKLGVGFGLETGRSDGAAAAMNDPVSAWRAPFFEGGAVVRHCVLRVTWQEADCLLWNALAQDLGIDPAAPLASVLINDAGTRSVYAYDDRGMDISALDGESLRGLYQRFDEWLLDYDRPRMAALFADAG